MEKPRLLLINPTALKRDGSPLKQRKTYLPGLTMLQLAALTPSDFEVRVISESSENIPFDEHWDVVGIGAMGGSGMVRAWQLADIFKKSGAKVIMGGIAATLGEKSWTLEHADTIVLGEADEIWGNILSDFLNGNLKTEYQMQQVPDVSKFPTPAYHLLDKSKYGFWRPVQATRGCPFTCTFCSISTFYNQSYRKRPVEQIVRDVRMAKAHSGTKYITFIDDNIGVDFNYCRELWTALIPEKIIWASQCSLQIAQNDELLDLAYRSGCRILSFGIESVNPSSLTHVDKEWNKPDTYAKAIKNLKKHGIEVSTEMILGLDGDDINVFQSTFDFIMNNQIALPRLYIITPVPGTAFHNQMESDGRIFERNFSKYNGGDIVFHPKNMDAETLQKGYWKLYNELYSVKNIYKRLAKNESQQDYIMKIFIWATNFHYRSHILKGITPGIV